MDIDNHSLCQKYLLVLLKTGHHHQLSSSFQGWDNVGQGHDPRLERLVPASRKFWNFVEKHLWVR